MGVKYIHYHKQTGIYDDAVYVPLCYGISMQDDTMCVTVLKIAFDSLSIAY